MFFFYLNSNPLCYEGLSSLCFPFHSTFGHIFAQNVAIRHHFHTFGHIFANFVAIIPFRSSFERIFPKNVSISRFKLHFGRIFVQNALVLPFHHPFGHTFLKNVPILPLFVIRLIAAGTSSEKLCLSWAKLFHIPVTCRFIRSSFCLKCARFRLPAPVWLHFSSKCAHLCLFSGPPVGRRSDKGE